MRSREEWERFAHSVVNALPNRGISYPDIEAFVRYEASAVLGIPVCRECGCTDISACDGGCEWVAMDLCSACVNTHQRKESDGS